MATEVVNRYSGVKFQEQTRTQLIDKLSFPGGVVTPFVPADQLVAIMKGQGAPVVNTNVLLAELGYYSAPLGPEDFASALGRMTDATRRFQKDRGLTPDGVMNKQTRDELLRAVEQKRAGKK